jgi:hypothetical protein
MNDSLFGRKQRSTPQAKRDQACKQMGPPCLPVFAHHDAAKLLVRLKAAM